MASSWIEMPPSEPEEVLGQPQGLAWLVSKTHNHLVRNAEKKKKEKKKGPSVVIRPYHSVQEYLPKQHCPSISLLLGCVPSFDDKEVVLMTTVAHDGAQRIDFPHTIHDELDLSKYKKILFFFFVFAGKM